MFKKVLLLYQNVVTNKQKIPKKYLFKVDIYV